MPTIKLFESWLSDQTGQVNEEGATGASPITPQELAKEAIGKEIGKPFCLAKKGLIIDPVLLSSKDGVEFYIYPIQQSPETSLPTFKSILTTSGSPIADTKIPDLSSSIGTGSGETTQKVVGTTAVNPVLMNVGTIVDLYANFKGTNTALTPDEYLTMLDSSKPGYSKLIATIASEPDQAKAKVKLIKVGTPDMAETANQAALIAAAIAKSKPAAPAATAPAATVATAAAPAPAAPKA